MTNEGFEKNNGNKKFLSLYPLSSVHFAYVSIQIIFKVWTNSWIYTHRNSRTHKFTHTEVQSVVFFRVVKQSAVDVHHGIYAAGGSSRWEVYIETQMGFLQVVLTSGFHPRIQRVKRSVASNLNHISFKFTIFFKPIRNILNQEADVAEKLTSPKSK